MLNARLSPLSLRQIMASLALAAAMLGALVPSGWMPQAQADGSVTLVICTSEGMRELTLDADGNPVEAETPDTSALEAPCAFSGLNAPAALPAPCPDALHLAPVNDVPAPPASTSGRSTHPVSLPGQRGPPQRSLTDLQTA